jgi:shikimate dehydrogenase
MEENYQYDLVGVFGDPVSENTTVVMFDAAFRKLKLKWKYLNMNVAKRDLPDAVRGLRAFQNMRGINLTIPHKVAVLRHLDDIAHDAGVMGAVNTVRKRGEKLIGENTDGKGFLRSLTQDARFSPAAKRAVILGAGGAARAISIELAFAQMQQITIVNRTKNKGDELARLISKNTRVIVDFVQWDGIFSIPSGTDMVINATSIGLFPNLSEQTNIDYKSITEKMIVCDVIPNPPNTLFLRDAKGQGAQTLDGLGMLVYQGAIAFEMWTGIKAPVEVMKEALKRAFEI